MYWQHVGRTDGRARIIADRHYSRKTVGAVEFCPPGNSIVLLGLDHKAIWVSHRPDPNANIVKRRADGFDYYDNTYFRNESGLQSSGLIREALAITRFLWTDYPPPDGFHSFTDKRYVRPTMVHGKPVYGFCFLKAGFYLYEHETKSRSLCRWIMSLEDYLAIEPQSPIYEQLSLF